MRNVSQSQPVTASSHGGVTCPPGQPREMVAAPQDDRPEPGQWNKMSPLSNRRGAPRPVRCRRHRNRSPVTQPQGRSASGSTDPDRPRPSQAHRPGRCPAPTHHPGPIDTSHRPGQTPDRPPPRPGFDGASGATGSSAPRRCRAGGRGVSVQPLALAMILSVARVSVSTGPVTRIGDVPGPQVRRRGVGQGHPVAAA